MWNIVPQLLRCVLSRVSYKEEPDDGARITQSTHVFLFLITCKGPCRASLVPLPALLSLPPSMPPPPAMSPMSSPLPRAKRQKLDTPESEMESEIDWDTTSESEQNVNNDHHSHESATAACSSTFCGFAGVGLVMVYHLSLWRKSFQPARKLCSSCART